MLQSACKAMLTDLLHLFFCFSANRSLEPVQILCIVGHIVCLILEGVAGYVERIRQAIYRQATER